MDAGTRRVAVLGLCWLAREMKRDNNAFYDADIYTNLVGQADAALRATLLSYNTRCAILSYFTFVPLQ
jgi:hypothetical protein